MDQNLHDFEREQIEWSDRFITVVDKFTPHFGTTLLTEKFYARHDALSEEAGHKPNVWKYMKEVAYRQVSGPREINPIPVTENQMYGWLCDKVITYEDENDLELIVHRKQVDTQMKIQMDVNLGIKRDRMYHMLR